MQRAGITYLERYQNGEYEQVWTELVAWVPKFGNQS